VDAALIRSGVSRSTVADISEPLGLSMLIANDARWTAPGHFIDVVQRFELDPAGDDTQSTGSFDVGARMDDGRSSRRSSSSRLRLVECLHQFAPGARRLGTTNTRASPALEHVGQTDHEPRRR
jgi:hypothetical protein